MKAKTLDKQIKDQVKKVAHLPPVGVSWNIDQSWDKIARLLRQAHPKSILWYCSLAASISLVMANVSLLPDQWSEEAHHVQESTFALMDLPQAPKSRAATTHLPESKDPVFSAIHPKKIQSYGGITHIPSHGPVALPATSNVHHTKATGKVTLIPRLYTGINAAGVGLSGELIVSTNKKINTASLGMSVELNTHFLNHSGRENMATNLTRQSVYMNMVLINTQAKRPWSARIGTPLWQTEAHDSGAPVIKVNYQTTLGKKIQIGPELIFTKGFKKVYPGITLSFG